MKWYNQEAAKVVKNIQKSLKLYEGIKASSGKKNNIRPSPNCSNQTKEVFWVFDKTKWKQVQLSQNKNGKQVQNSQFNDWSFGRKRSARSMALAIPAKAKMIWRTILKSD